jgi:hypothetical protein
LVGRVRGWSGRPLFPAGGVSGSGLFGMARPLMSGRIRPALPGRPRSAPETLLLRRSSVNRERSRVVSQFEIGTRTRRD